jgi:hypothetical protein
VGLARPPRRLGPAPAEWETVLAELRARAAAAAGRAGHVLFDDEMD